MSENIFVDDWYACMRAHYMHVIRTNDRVTLPSLTVVMKRVGFSESDLAELRVQATMHVDDVGTDFTPDLNILHREDEARVFAVGKTGSAPEPAVQRREEESQIGENLSEAAELPEPDVEVATSSAAVFAPSAETVEGAEEPVTEVEMSEEAPQAEAEGFPEIETAEEPPEMPEQLSLF